MQTFCQRLAKTKRVAKVIFSVKKSSCLSAEQRIAAVAFGCIQGTAGDVELGLKVEEKKGWSRVQQSRKSGIPEQKGRDPHVRSTAVDLRSNDGGSVRRYRV